MAGWAGWRHLPPHRVVLVAVCATGLAIASLDGWRTWEDRATVLAMDKTDTSNLAMSVASRVHAIIEKSEIILTDMREHVRNDGIATLHGDRLRAVMQEHPKHRPILQDLFVFDASGLPVIATEPNPAGIADRAYFRFHQQHDDPGVRVWEPARASASGPWILPITGRITGQDGAFGGVVLATISIDGLNAAFAQFNVGAQGSITLTTSSGIMIARAPAYANITGRDIADSPLFAEIRRHPGTGNVRYVSPIDNTAREGSYASVEDYPLDIIVAHGVSELLANWRSEAVQHLTLSTAAALILVLCGTAFSRQMKASQAADRRYRMLMENSNDIIIGFTRSGHRLFVSPAVLTMTGWSVQETLGRDWSSMLHPEDRPIVLALKSQLAAGVPSVTASYRMIRKDGTTMWVETRSRTAGTGDCDGIAFIANVRDISQRKAAEDKIEALNAELLKLATTDALTGLANRRRFDAALTEEWQRAYREGTSLSLLLLDIDRFKLFNDRYGHQTGDSCLQIIAAAIDQCTRRHGDLVARYGGEEIAVILPRSHPAGAAARAERIRQAIQATGIEHLDNLPDALVTVSIGAATTTPLEFEGLGGIKALVAAADTALYQAKRSGRNRVVEASPFVPAT